MNVRAAIFDIYHTLLEISPPPADAEARWVALWLETFGGPPRFDLAGFGAACDIVIAREHAAARTAGVPFPEIFWPDVVAEVLPELDQVPMKSPDVFMLRHAALRHTVKLDPLAAAQLRRLREQGVLLGLVSNCQPYTLTEMESEFEAAGLSLDIFDPSLRFLSFEHGFSKPDPHVFRLLAARLRMMDITVAEALVVGDRFDNDIAPARAQGWPTWHFGPRGTPGGGDWQELSEFLNRPTPPSAK